MFVGRNPHLRGVRFAQRPFIVVAISWSLSNARVLALFSDDVFRHQDLPPTTFELL